jgi:hypothetical protein
MTWASTAALIVLAGALLAATSNCSRQPDQAAAMQSANTINESLSVRSAPPDRSSHTRPAIPEDLNPGGKPAIPAGVATKLIPHGSPTPGVNSDGHGTKGPEPPDSLEGS